jgi:hypothetical protein
MSLTAAAVANCYRASPTDQHYFDMASQGTPKVDHRHIVFANVWQKAQPHL